MLLIQVDQYFNGRYVNSVYGDSLQLVKRSDYSFYKLEMNKSIVATFTNTASQSFQFSMYKVAADYTDGFTTVQHWCWDAAEKA